MNTKLTFALLMIVAAIVSACTPAIVDSSAPIAPAVPPADNETSALMPVTGETAANAVRVPQEPRLWSGEISLSDNDSPDYGQNTQPAVSEIPQNDCMSEDSQPRRQSGCVE